jgi:hypothetical protein
MIANSSYRLSSQLQSETIFSRKPENMFWARTGLLLGIRTFWELFIVHPNWDPNSHAGKEALTNYRWLLIMGV